MTVLKNVKSVNYSNGSHSLSQNYFQHLEEVISNDLWFKTGLSEGVQVSNFYFGVTEEFLIITIAIAFWKWVTGRFSCKNEVGIKMTLERKPSRFNC